MSKFCKLFFVSYIMENFMRRSIQQMKTEFREHWKAYTLQSLLATVILAGVFTFLTKQYAVIVASIGASTFIVFAMPKNIVSKTQNIIGGHIIGLLTGFLGYWLGTITSIPDVIPYALAVGLSMFIMVVVDLEHPPASGTALGVAIAGFSWRVAVAMVVAVGLLALAHRFLKRFIRDLV